MRDNDTSDIFRKIPSVQNSAVGFISKKLLIGKIAFIRLQFKGFAEFAAKETIVAMRARSRNSKLISQGYLVWICRAIYIKFKIKDWIFFPFVFAIPFSLLGHLRISPACLMTHVTALRRKFKDPTCKGTSPFEYEMNIVLKGSNC